MSPDVFVPPWLVSVYPPLTGGGPFLYGESVSEWPAGAPLCAAATCTHAAAPNDAATTIEILFVFDMEPPSAELASATYIELFASLYVP